MKTEKTFDCVKMKNDIQESLRREREGMSQDEVRKTIERKLATSSSPIAKMWRRLVKTQKDASARRSVKLSRTS